MNILLDIGTVLAEAVSFFMLLDGFMTKKEFAKRYSFLKYLVFIVVLSITANMNLGLIGNFLAFIIVCFSCSFFYTGNMKNRIIISVSFFGIGCALEYIVGAAIMAVTAISPTEFSLKEEYYMIGSVVSKILTLLITKIICILFSKRQATYTSYWLILMTIPVINILLLISMIFFFESTSPNAVVALGIAMCGILYSDIIVFYLYDKLIDMFELRLKNAMLTQQIDVQDESIRAAFKENTKTQSIKHDFNNHLLILKTMIAQNKNEEVIKYLNEFSNNIEVDKIINSGCIPLDAILNAKFGEAKQKGIEIECNINPIPSDLNISGIDACMLFGNLLDNAIEACDEISNKKIYFGIGYISEQLVIETRNYTKKKVKFIDNLPISDKADKLNHGIGTRNIIEVVNKYNGICKMECDGNEFKTTIVLFEV